MCLHLTLWFLVVFALPNRTGLLLDVNDEHGEWEVGNCSCFPRTFDDKSYLGHVAPVAPVCLSVRHAPVTSSPGLFPSLFSVHTVLLWMRPPGTVPYRPTSSKQNLSVVMCALLLLLSGDVELNPGSSLSSLNIGSLNICSAVNKVGCIHDIVSDFGLDLLALCETRIQGRDTPAVKDCIAPDGYSVLHVHRQPSAHRPAGGGLAIIHSNSTIVRPWNVNFNKQFQTFEHQLVRVTSTRPSLSVANIYRPPNTPIRQFCDEMVEFLSVIESTSDRLILCGDVNCPGPDSSSVDPNLADVFETFSMTQHVKSPTRNNNLLDVLVTDDAVTVTNVSVDDAGLVSDHRLVMAIIHAPQTRPCVTSTEY